jgi:hypothetical protein
MMSSQRLTDAAVFAMAKVGVSHCRDVDLVQVAPQLLVTLDPEPDDGVTGVAKVLGGVFPGRRVAAADVAADET